MWTHFWNRFSRHLKQPWPPACRAIKTLPMGAAKLLPRPFEIIWLLICRGSGESGINWSSFVASCFREWNSIAPIFYAKAKFDAMYCEVRIQNSSPIFTFRCPSRCPFVTMISPLDLGVKSRKRWDYYQCAPISQFATFALVVWFPRSLGNQSPGTQALISNQKSRHRVIITTRELFFLSTLGSSFNVGL